MTAIAVPIRGVALALAIRARGNALDDKAAVGISDDILAGPDEYVVGPGLIHPMRGADDWFAVRDNTAFDTSPRRRATFKAWLSFGAASAGLSWRSAFRGGTVMISP